MNQTSPQAARVVDILAPGAWSDPASDHITLDYDGRHRRRIVLTAEHGARFLLDLPETRLLPGGAALALDDGRLIEVIARQEDLLEVRARDVAALLRLAWHIGNRHLTAQVEVQRILIRRDHVIAEMLRGLGASVRDVVEPFNPEGGAYDGRHGHSHGDRNGHGHGHHHGHFRGHGD